MSDSFLYLKNKIIWYKMSDNKTPLEVLLLNLINFKE